MRILKLTPILFLASCLIRRSSRHATHPSPLAPGSLVLVAASGVRRIACEGSLWRPLAACGQSRRVPPALAADGRTVGSPEDVRVGESSLHLGASEI